MDKKQTLGGRIPPQDLDAEKALLGSIMLSPDSLHDITDTVSGETFYSEKNKLVFENMLELAHKREPIDLVSVTNKLKEKKVFDTIGGGLYLSELLNSVPSSANISYYAQILRKKKVLRNLIGAANEISELGYTEHEDLEDTLENAEKRIYSITSVTSGNQKFTRLRDTIDEAWSRLERLHDNKGELRGVPTGIPPLDDKLSGLQKTDLIILAARPSVGKTSFALEITRNAAFKHDVPVGVFSLEMGVEQLVDRMMAAEAKVDLWKLRTGKLSLDEDFERIRNSLDRFNKAPIFIDDQAANSINRMKSVIRRYNVEHDVPMGLVIVDYLQLMSTAKNYDSMVNQVTEISRSLKALAKEFNLPVLALSQLSRAVEARGGRPRLSDLRDSGSIEQDADVVMFLHRENKEEDTFGSYDLDVLIEKHRNGPTGEVKLKFDAKKMSFTDMANGFGEFSIPNMPSFDPETF
jgi:replicative DNA helicase